MGMVLAGGGNAAVSRRARPLMVMPLVVLVTMLTMVLATFTITSWNVDELASVAARRLLSQLTIPACCVLAAAASGGFRLVGPISFRGEILKQ
jgi:hypothetical protein